MIFLALVLGVLVGLAPALLLLRAERDRVNDLLRLLESKAAPAEVAAYLDPAPALPEKNETWIFSHDGLVGALVDD